MHARIEGLPQATERRRGKGRHRAEGKHDGSVSDYRAFNQIEEGTAYSDEDREFLVAIDRYKRERNRPHPHWTEVLDVLRGLGWEKRKPT